jgi:hypothetical protein
MFGHLMRVKSPIGFVLYLPAGIVQAIRHIYSTRGAQLLISADVSLAPALFLSKPRWQPWQDQHSEMAVETRARIFDKAVADRMFNSLRLIESPLNTSRSADYIALAKLELRAAP